MYDKDKKSKVIQFPKKEIKIVKFRPMEEILKENRRIRKEKIESVLKKLDDILNGD